MVICSQKSATYSCQVRNAAGTASAESRVDVVGTGEVPECPAERAAAEAAEGDAEDDADADGEGPWLWATTPAGEEARIECSELLDYTGGLARRQCVSKGDTAEWDVPDFSECVHEDFAAIRDKVRGEGEGATSPHTSSAAEEFLSFKDALGQAANCQQVVM